MDFPNMSLSEFTDALASRSAVPGGGGASALVGALGIALGSMVGNLTVGKPRYAAVEENIKALIVEAENLQQELMSLIARDAEVFKPLSLAYSIPKDAPGRDETMEKCLRNACSVPYEIVRLSCRAIELHSEFAEKGSVLAVSDAATGVSFCCAALLGGAANVRVNTHSMKDRDYADKINSEVSELCLKYQKMAVSVYSSVMERLK